MCAYPREGRSDEGGEREQDMIWNMQSIMLGASELTIAIEKTHGEVDRATEASRRFEVCHYLCNNTNGVSRIGLSG